MTQAKKNCRLDRVERPHHGKQAQKVGAEITGFTWIDDGKPGVIREVGVTDPVTGERMTIVLSGAA